MLQNGWDEVVSHQLVRCESCGEVVYTELLKDSIDSRLREMAEPLCPRHKLERQAAALCGRQQPPGRSAP